MIDVEPLAPPVEAPAPDVAAVTPPELVLWWLRPDVPDVFVHAQDLERPGHTRCRRTLNSHFRPATAAEAQHRKKCRVCVPRPAHAPKQSERPVSITKGGRRIR